MPGGRPRRPISRTAVNLTVGITSAVPIAGTETDTEKQPWQ